MKTTSKTITLLTIIGALLFGALSTALPDENIAHRGTDSPGETGVYLCFTDRDAPFPTAIGWAKHAILIQWQDFCGIETGFIVFRFHVEDGRYWFDGWAVLPPDSTEFLDRRVKKDVIYRYCVKAYNECGLSGYYDYPLVTTKGPVTEPVNIIE